MNSMLTVWVILAAVAVWQLWVTAMLIRAPHLEPQQKWLQSALVWLIPLFGAVFVYVMLWSEGRAPYQPEKGYTVPGDNASGPE